MVSSARVSAIAAGAVRPATLRSPRAKVATAWVCLARPRRFKRTDGLRMSGLLSDGGTGRSGEDGRPRRRLAARGQGATGERGTPERYELGPVEPPRGDAEGR